MGNSDLQDMLNSSDVFELTIVFFFSHSRSLQIETGMVDNVFGVYKMRTGIFAGL